MSELVQEAMLGLAIDRMMTADKAALLRAPFPKDAISRLPKGGTSLEYVGHAHVTDRLLQVDPFWSWEPLAFDADGLPKFDEHGGLWIKLTVCGVTRIGYGEPQGSDFFDKRKGAVGNALRVAAMRFGVALDLWSKDGVADSTPTPPKPVASEMDVKRWLKAFESARSEDAVKKVTAQIVTHQVSDAHREELRAGLEAARVRLAGGEPGE